MEFQRRDPREGVEIAMGMEDPRARLEALRSEYAVDGAPTVMPRRFALRYISAAPAAPGVTASDTRPQ